jgi:hypothetical protein
MYHISSKFKGTESFRSAAHNGIDIPLPKGTTLKAIQEGSIRIKDYGNVNAGKTVFIDGADGKTYIYGHLSEFKVKDGQHVEVGDTLGLSGNTGYVVGENGGYHLHFGLKENGHFIDPTPLAEKVADNTGSTWQRFLENGDVSNNDYPTIWGWMYEKTFGNGIEHFIADYISALPLLAVVSIGVFGLCNMFSRTFAKLGVGLTFLFGGLAIL